jgi:hypothetical protein
MKKILGTLLLGLLALALAACGEDPQPPPTGPAKAAPVEDEAPPKRQRTTDVACDRFAAPDGSDSADGSESAPLDTVQALADSLAAGEIGCLREGVYVAESDDDHDEVLTLDHGGEDGSPIVISGYPGERATLEGIVTVQEGADDVILNNLVIEGSGESNTVKVYSEDVVVENSEITNEGRGLSCMILGSNDGDGQAVRTVVRGNVFRDCGSEDNDNKDHGIYASNVVDGEIVGNVIYGSAAYAIQLYPNAQGTRFAHNVIDGGGSSVRGGVAFGGDDHYASANNVVERNVIAHSATLNITSSWDEETGEGNVARENCLWEGGEGEILADGGFEASDNVEADPGFRSRADRDYRLDPRGKCRETVGYDPAARLSDAAR